MRAMRRAVLRRSVMNLLDPGEAVGEAAFMWARHRAGYAIALGAWVVFTLVAVAAGFDEWPTRVVIGLAGGAVALTLTTDYRVLASTTNGLVLLDAGRVRQVARRLRRRLPPDTSIRLVRDTLITTDWEVDGVEYTVPKGSQRAMEVIAAQRTGRPPGV